MTVESNDGHKPEPPERSFELRTAGVRVSIDRSTAARLWRGAAVVSTTACLTVAAVASQNPELLQ